jgi:exodeoxyribonuclease-3
MMLKLISWNVNGLRACAKKGFYYDALALGADAICLQETKLSDIIPELQPAGYCAFWNNAEKKGYSGTAVFSRAEPLSVSYGMGIADHDHEGRVIALEYERFYLVNCYTPNSQHGLLRLDYRMNWEDDFRAYLLALAAKKPVALCGDLNVAHAEIDLKNPKSNRMNAGFTDREREKFSMLLNHGFIDSFRHFYPDKRNAYTWWSYMGNARANNTGWRIDYFCVSDALKGGMVSAAIHDGIYGSDHCPIELILEV